MTLATSAILPLVDFFVNSANELPNYSWEVIALLSYTALVQVMRMAAKAVKVKTEVRILLQYKIYIIIIYAIVISINQLRSEH